MPFDAGRPEVSGTLDVLLKAREYLSDPDRWCKRRAYVWRGNHEIVSACLSGAVTYARCGMSPFLYDLERSRPSKLAHESDARSWLEQAILERIGSTDSITYFNDIPETKHADVIAVLDRAIELCRGHV